MKMVFEKFEKSLTIERGMISVIRIEDRSLYARCTLSLAKRFDADVLEPAYFFKKETEFKPDKILFFVGDLLTFDLNDKRIISLAQKIILARIIAEQGYTEQLEKLNFQLEEVFSEQFIQMSANYYFAGNWDSLKYLKMLGFGIDDVNDRTLFEKLTHLMRVVADLFPSMIIAFVNLPIYLTDDQYQSFCDSIASLQLSVLSYEQGTERSFTHLENGIFIDANYLES